MAGPPPVPGRGGDQPLPPRRRRPRPSSPTPRVPRTEPLVGERERPGDGFAPPAAPPRSRPARGGGAPRRPPLVRRRRLLIGAGFVVAIAAIWFLFSLFQPFSGSGNGRVTVTIPRGSSVSTIGDVLANRGVVSSSFFFQVRATIEGDRGELKPGTYTLQHGMSYASALTALIKGPQPSIITVTIPEGLSRAEIARRLRPGELGGSYLDATKSSPELNPASYGAKQATDLEGFLFPSTYQLRLGASVTTLVDKQLAAFKARFANIDMSAARRANLTPYDVVVIASLIEREAEVESERPLIASVIYNRLRVGMPLGIDATTRFITGNWTQPLTESELAIQSPYNTRIHTGLPPGPIGNPGLASLEAAANPANTDYLYYVANPCKPGTHSFASTAAQFNLDSQRYQEARAAAGGRAPTGC